MTTVAGSTPYAWPYDGDLAPARTALLVVRGADAPALPATVAPLAQRLHDLGGAVVAVTTAPPRRSAPDDRSTPMGPAATVVESDHPIDETVVAAGLDGFHGSPLDALLRRTGRDRLLLVGGWLETSVHSTMRSANDRGYECLLVLDGCVPFDPDLRAASRSQIEMSGGIFGAVGETDAVLAALGRP
ncbi:cysteine hydrolase family protein [Nocardioides sp.]|uniref:cysteine hydrolase family protein n=1 Tax=Nocardioides sp. TaxID=35761 RepID=UPI003513A6DD